MKKYKPFVVLRSERSKVEKVGGGTLTEYYANWVPDELGFITVECHTEGRDVNLYIFTPDRRRSFARAI